MIGDLNQKHGCRVTDVSPEVLARFSAGSWPGNVRELRNVIERAIIVAGQGAIEMRHLPGAYAPEPSPPEPLPEPSLAGVPRLWRKTAPFRFAPAPL